MRFRVKYSEGSQRIDSGYRLNVIGLQHMKSYGDLKVLVGSSLKFHDHINVTMNKASGLANHFLRSTVNSSSDSMVSLFISHVRPILDYCSTIWNLIKSKVGNIKKTQCRWIKEVDGLANLNYAARLQKSGLMVF